MLSPLDTIIYLQEFYWNGSVIKLDVEVDIMSKWLAVPSRGKIHEGMPIDTFYRMLSDFIRNKLGPSQHLALFQRIVSIADFNQNGQVSVYQGLHRLEKALHLG